MLKFRNGSNSEFQATDKVFSRVIISIWFWYALLNMLVSLKINNSAIVDFMLYIKRPLITVSLDQHNIKLWTCVIVYRTLYLSMIICTITCNTAICIHVHSRSPQSDRFWFCILILTSSLIRFQHSFVNICFGMKLNTSVFLVSDAKVDM